MQNPSKSAEPENELSSMALAQLYRGELGRSDRWRTRLDTSTNWALTVTAAVISIGFGSVDAKHVTILVGIWLVITFLIIETRRYRYYDLWIRRVRLLEIGVWAPLLRHEPMDSDALRELALDLERPQLQLSFAVALETRLTRAYGSILTLLIAAWFAKVTSHPHPVANWREFIARAHIGVVSGWIVTGSMVLLLLALVTLLVLTRFTRLPLGELRPLTASRRHSLWEAFYRPYLSPLPRRHSAGPPSLP